MADFVEELEHGARARFVRWDAALWHEMLHGPVPALGGALVSAGGESARPLLESYLRMTAEAIGLGYLVPASAGRGNFFTLAWTRLIPDLLAKLPAEQWAQTLATCWNLGENLEQAPPWLQRIFCRLFVNLDSLEGLEERVSAVSGTALETPQSPKLFQHPPRIEWLHLGAEDPRFLPGRLHFLAPTVLCVHDRHRGAVAGREAVTQGVWLTDPPVLLGPMGCQETPAPPGLNPMFTRFLEQRDVRGGDWFAFASNDWRAAATLHTSQYVVALLPP